MQEREEALREFESGQPDAPVTAVAPAGEEVASSAAEVIVQEAPKLSDEQRAQLEEKRKLALSRLEARKKAMSQLDSSSLEII